MLTEVCKYKKALKFNIFFKSNIKKCSVNMSNIYHRFIVKNKLTIIY